jgi:hypothetical protein
MSPSAFRLAARVTAGLAVSNSPGSTRTRRGRLTTVEGSLPTAAQRQNSIVKYLLDY